MYIERGANTLINNTFSGNIATSNNGGAIYTDNGTHTFANNIFGVTKKEQTPL
jgi:predicted outer membrane repeat protein